MSLNKVRDILNENKPSVNTRIWSTWPTVVEAAAVGFQAILFTDHETPDQVRETLKLWKNSRNHWTWKNRTGNSQNPECHGHESDCLRCVRKRSRNAVCYGNSTYAIRL